MSNQTWSCPGCGTRRAFTDLDGYGIGKCWRCNITFDPEALITCGLIGEPLPFGERLNRFTDGE